MEQNVERKIGKASVRDAIIGTGVAIDKMLALTGQTPVGIQVANIVMPTPEEREGRRRVHHALDEVARLLQKPQPLSPEDKLLLKAQCRFLQITDEARNGGRNAKDGG